MILLKLHYRNYNQLIIIQLVHDDTFTTEPLHSFINGDNTEGPKPAIILHCAQKVMVI